MGIADKMPWSKGKIATAGTSRAAFFKEQGFRGTILLMLRLFQVVMAITVIGLYAQDLVRAKKAHVYYDAKWMYATIIGTLSTLWAVACMTPWVKAWFLFILDYLMFLLYLVAFGIFGKMYINEDPEGNKGIIRMKHAVWILLVNLLLWFITATWGAVVFMRGRKARTTHTGQAPMSAV
jgi:hypothetical protein